MTYPAAPETFSFGSEILVGRLLGFSTKDVRRAVIHEYLKIDGARVEDMNSGPTRMSVRLAFIGADCAVKYALFAEYVRENPKGLLVHPIVGQFYAFCEGTGDEVSFDRATNEIEVTVSFVESNLDKPPPDADTPSVISAQAAATAQIAAVDQSAANLLVDSSVPLAPSGAAMAAIQMAATQVGAVADSIGTVMTAITASGISPARLAVLVAVQTQTQLLELNVASFIAAASDIYTGSEPPAAAAIQLATLFGIVVAQVEATEAALLAAAVTPAGAADAVGAVEELLAACYVLSAAAQQALPPVVPFTVPIQIGVVPLCVQLYPGADPLAMATTLLAINDIPNPAAIPAGTAIMVPSLAS